MSRSVLLLLFFVHMLLLVSARSSSCAKSDGTQRSQPASSSTIILDSKQNRVYVVNTDTHTVSVLDAATHQKIAEKPVGREPRTLAIDAREEKLFVANRWDNTISVLALKDLATLATLAVADEPCGIVCSPVEDLAIVASSGAAVLSFLDTGAHQIIARLPVPPHPRGLAMSADGQRLWVTHFLSGQVSVVDVPQRRVITALSTGADSNMAEHIVVNRTGTRAYLPHIRSHTAAPSMLFDTIVLPVVSVLDLTKSQHLRKDRIGLDAVDRPVNMPCVAALSAEGRRLYVVNAGSDDLSVLDLETGQAIAHRDVGSNPRGIVLTDDGKKAFISNRVSHDVTVIDLPSNKEIARVTVTEDQRPARVQRGQALFFSSARPEISRDRWISCASCHFDGGIDGRTWNTPRGPRNTQALFNVHETAPLHWSADRATVQEFQKTIINEMGGTGLSPAELDDLAAYVKSLRLRPNPNVQADGSISPAAKRGQGLFEAAKTQCATCHPAPLYTDRKLHDVSTGAGSGEKLGPAFDTPSLRGIYATAPYLHDGSAATLKDVLSTRNAGDRHGVTSHLTAQEIDDLVAFLRTR